MKHQREQQLHAVVGVEADEKDAQHLHGLRGTDQTNHLLPSTILSRRASRQAEHDRYVPPRSSRGRAPRARCASTVSATRPLKAKRPTPMRICRRVDEDLQNLQQARRGRRRCLRRSGGSDRRLRPADRKRRPARHEPHAVAIVGPIRRFDRALREPREDGAQEVDAVDRGRRVVDARRQRLERDVDDLPDAVGRVLMHRAMTCPRVGRVELRTSVVVQRLAGHRRQADVASMTNSPMPRSIRTTMSRSRATANRASASTPWM